MIEFIRKYPWLLLFGVLTAAFSSPGQTFLVSLFIPHMREEFGLSQTEIAAGSSIDFKTQVQNPPAAAYKVDMNFAVRK